MRIALLSILYLILVGCQTTPDIKYVDKYVPIIVVPPPPTIEIPEYHANELTEEQKQSIGELSKAYVISSQQAVNYASNLRQVYDLFQELANESQERLEQLESMGLEVDRSLLEQANIEIQQQLNALGATLKNQNEMHSLQMSKTLSEFQ